jgi:hypothetical protein
LTTRSPLTVAAVLSVEQAQKHSTSAATAIRFAFISFMLL